MLSINEYDSKSYKVMSGGEEIEIVSGKKCIAFINISKTLHRLDKKYLPFERDSYIPDLITTILQASNVNVPYETSHKKIECICDDGIFYEMDKCASLCNDFELLYEASKFESILSKPL